MRLLILLAPIQYIGLQILEQLVTTRWKAIPDAQRQGINTFSQV